MKPRFPAIRKHQFGDRDWKIIWRRPKRDKKLPVNKEYHGNCDANTGRIWIYPSEDPLELLHTVLDEGTHGCFFDLDNDAVATYADDVIALLKRMGIKISFKP